MEEKEREEKRRQDERDREERRLLEERRIDAELEKEKLKAEAMERDKAAERDYTLELERLRLQQPAGAETRDPRQGSNPQLPRLPCFKHESDDIDSYLFR